VVLEAPGCGRRVVATAVGGVPDLLGRPELGTLLLPAIRALGVALAHALRTDTTRGGRQARIFGVGRRGGGPARRTRWRG
jgi:glycosyltransferase involved in cell wall biosynthesis